MTKKNADVLKILLSGLAATVALICAFFDAAMLKELLTPWIIPVLCVLPVGAALALPLRHPVSRLTGSAMVWLNTLCALVFAVPVVLMVVLLANRLSTVERTDIPVVVERVYKETRYKTKRVSRRHYTRGTPYKVTRADVKLPDGHTRSIDVTKRVYKNMSKGDTVDIPVTTGIFRLSYLDASHIHLRRLKEDRNGCTTVSRRPQRPGSSSEEVMLRHRARIDSIRRQYYQKHKQSQRD